MLHPGALPLQCPASYRGIGCSSGYPGGAPRRRGAAAAPSPCLLTRPTRLAHLPLRCAAHHPRQATTCERKVRVYDLETDTESYIPEGETLISMSLSRDGRHLLVNLTR